MIKNKRAPKPGQVKVDFTLPGRTIFNVSSTVRYNTAPGIIDFVKAYPLIPRDRFECKITATERTFPSLAPMLSSYRSRIYAFWVPRRLYTPELRINDVSASVADYGFEDFSDAEFPTFKLTGASSDDLVSGTPVPVPRGGLLEQIGLPAGFFVRILGDGSSVPEMRFNAHRILSYYDIFRNYFANANASYYFGYKPSNDVGSSGAISYTWNPASIGRFSLIVLNDYYVNQGYLTRNRVIGASITEEGGDSPYGMPFEINQLDNIDYEGVSTGVYGSLSTVPGLLGSKGAGLLVKSYMPDFMNTFVGSGAYNQMIAKSIVSTLGDKLKMSDLLVGQKIYNYYSKLAATGRRYDEFIRAEFGVDVRKYLDIPVFLRTFTFGMNFDTVVSNTPANTTDQTGLGQQAGIGHGSFGNENNNKLNFTADEYGELIFLKAIEPIVDYAYGVDPFLLELRYDDMYTPSLDRIGLEPLFQSQVDALENTAPDVLDPDLNIWYHNPFEEVRGYQPAFTRYTTDYNRVYGDLAGDLSYWVNLGPKSGTIGDYGYIDPQLFIRQFQDTSEASRPFISQVGFDAVVKRAKSARPMSNFN